MSILGNHPPVLINGLITVGIFILFFASIALMGLLRVYRPRMVTGPQRLAPGQPVWPVAVAMGITVFVWFGVQIMFGALKGIEASHHGVKFDVSMLTAKDFAFLSTVPAILGFATLWIADVAVGGIELLSQLGFTLRKIAVGVGKGIVWGFIVIPPVYVFGFLVEWVYRKINYQTPQQHELLKAMSDTHSPAIRWTLIFAATLVAPLWEEFLFRAHLQTLIRKTIIVLSTPGSAKVFPATSSVPVLAMTDEPGKTILPMPLPLPQRDIRIGKTQSPVWQTWVAILITSCLFASVHEMWMWPPIFVLAIGLGYCYERTGNLWTNIVVHCLFNSISTAIYLGNLPT